MHTYIYLHTPYHLVSGKRRGQSGEAWREKGGAMYTSSMYTSVGTIDTSVGVYKRGGIGPIRAQIHVIYEYFCHFVYDQTRAIYVLTRSLVYSIYIGSYTYIRASSTCHHARIRLYTSHTYHHIPPSCTGIHTSYTFYTCQ
jgi:hypothetical protein